MVYKVGEEIILNLMYDGVQSVTVLKEIDTDIVTKKFLQTGNSGPGNFYNYLVKQGYVEKLNTTIWNVKDSITKCQVDYYLR